MNPGASGVNKISLTTQTTLPEDKFTWILSPSDTSNRFTLKGTSHDACFFGHIDSLGNVWRMRCDTSEGIAGSWLRLEVTRLPSQIDNHRRVVSMKVSGMAAIRKGDDDNLSTPYQCLGQLDEKILALRMDETRTTHFNVINQVPNVLSGEVLSIQVVVKHYDHSLLKAVPPFESNSVPRTSHWKNDLCFIRNLWNEGSSSVTSDFQVTLQSKTFYLHRVVLAAMSPGIDRLFKIGLIDNAVAETITQGLSLRTFELLLQYIYLRELPLGPQDTLQTVQKLMKTMDLWEIPKMKKLLAKNIINCVTVKNADESFDFCSRHELHKGTSQLYVFYHQHQQEIMKLRRERILKGIKPTGLCD